MKTTLPVLLRGSQEFLTVEYQANTSAAESGFDVLDVPFPKEKCIGYPTMHAYFENMKLSGYKRYCGFLQIVKREEVKYCKTSQVLFYDAPGEYFYQIGNPFCAYGFPASFYDAPCCNLGDCDLLTWKAYTYLVDLPSRMNGDRLQFLAGFSWGYREDASGPLGLLDFEILSEQDWKEHMKFLSTLCPDLPK